MSSMLPIATTVRIEKDKNRSKNISSNKDNDARYIQADKHTTVTECININDEKRGLDCDRLDCRGIYNCSGDCGNSLIRASILFYNSLIDASDNGLDPSLFNEKTSTKSHQEEMWEALLGFSKTILI